MAVSRRGGLFINFGIKTANLEKGLRRAKKASRATFKRISRAAKDTSRAIVTLGRSVGKLVGLFGGLAGLASIAGFSSLIRESLQLNDRLAKVADSLGESTEALFAFRRQADRAGISADKTDKALLRLQRNIGESVQGIGSAKESFEELGLSVEQLSVLSPVAAFNKISKALGEVDNQALRAALAYKVFGRQGQELVRVVEQGTDRFDEILEKVKTTGIVLSRFDASKVELANDTFADLKQTIGAIGNQITINLVAPLIAFTKALDEVVVKNKAFSAGIRTSFKIIGDIGIVILKFLPRVLAVFPEIVKGVSDGLALLLRLIDSIKNLLIKNLFGSFRTFGDLLQKQLDQIYPEQKIAKQGLKIGNRFRTAFRLALIKENPLDAFRGLFSDAVSNVVSEGQERQQKALALFFKGFGINADQVKPQLQGFVDFIKGVADTADSEARRTKETSKKGIGALIKFWTVGSARARKFADELKALDLAGPAKKAVDEVLAVFDKLESELAKKKKDDEAKKKLLVAEVQLRAFADGVKAFAESLGATDYLAPIISGLETFKVALSTTKEEVDKLDATEKFGAGIKKGLADLTKSFEEFGTTAQTLTKSIFSGLEDVFTDFVRNGKLSFTDLANTILEQLARIAVQQAVIAPLVKGFQGFFADGGKVEAGKPAFVGERGPELFVPSSNGTIVPNDQLGGSGDITSVVNVTVEGSADESTAVQIGRVVKDVVRGEIYDVFRTERKAGGAFA